MRRAPGPVGLAFGIAVAVLIVLAGPLLLFNPAFTSILQARHDVAGTFGVSEAEVGRVTAEMLGDVWTDGAFTAAFAGDAPLLDAPERSHMHDVAVLVRLLALVGAVAAVVVAIGAFVLRREPRRRGRILLIASAAIGGAALLLAIVFAVAFEPAFLAFHTIFFPPGSYLFEPGSNLITLFPEPFWFDATLAAGASVVIAAAIVALIGVRSKRTAPATV